MRVTVAVAAAVGVALLAAAPAMSHWPGLTNQPAALGRAAAPSHTGSGDRLSTRADLTPGGAQSSGRGDELNAGPRRSNHSSQGRVASRRQPRPRDAVLAHYRDPLRAISGLIPERIDMGVDFGGTGSIYALGNAVITSAVAGTAGWPGGGWITYRLTSGPAAGLMVFVAEDVTPTVSVGQAVTSSTVIATMFNGGAGIETGWAQPDAWSAESQSPAAGGISGGGPFPTMIGLNFEELLQALGVPAANNRDQLAYGLLPPDYPASW